MKSHFNKLLELQATASELWNEQKGLEWTRKTGERKRIFKRLEKGAEKLQNLLSEFKGEITVLKEMCKV